MHHVCLVSDQAIPNFLPLRSEELKPTKVTLVVTEAMEKKGKVSALKAEIKKRQIPLGEDVFLPDANDIPSITDILAAWLDQNTDDVVLNVTGGTKPMAIAAQEVFRMADRPVFYVDIATDRVLWIDDKKARSPIQLKDTLLKLRTLLGLNGITLTGGDFKSALTREDWRRFAEMLATNSKYNNVLGILNRYAEIADQHGRLDVDFDEPIRNYNRSVWDDLLLELKGNGLITSGDERHIRFVDKEARRFCNGIWLEHHVFEKIKKLRFSKDYAMMNASVQYGNDTKNELDAVLVTRNMLVLIECKTKNMKREGVADDAVYKLADLSQHLGGLRVKSILVSCRPLRGEDRKRAKLLGVNVIDNLSILESELKRLLELV